MAGMCPRHVAALAVVVWYLIVPSIHSDQLHPEYPLAQWVHLDSFDLAAECKRLSDFLTELFPRFGSDSTGLPCTKRGTKLLDNPAISLWNHAGNRLMMGGG